MQSENPTRFEYLTDTADAALQVALCGEHPGHICDHVVGIASTNVKERDALTVAEAEQDYWRNLETQLLK